MRKTISSGIDRRAVYKFKCSGPCQRVKYTYVYERAKKGRCLTCSKNEVDQNQESLFEHTAAVDEAINRINVNPYYSDQTKKDFINVIKHGATS